MNLKSKCTKCGLTEFRRINRQGWVQREFLPRVLGWYPWECVQCRGRRYFRDEGHFTPVPLGKPKEKTT